MATLTSDGGGAITLPFCHHEVGAWVSRKKALDFPGVDGSGRLDMGERYRPITIEGFLVDAVGGTTKATDIEDLDDSVLHTFDAVLGARKFPSCEVLSARTFDWAKTCGADGELQSCRYSIELQQIRRT